MLGIDSDFIIDFLKGKETAVQKMKELQGRSVFLYTTTPNMFEVLKGLKEDSKVVSALKFFNSLEILAFDIESSIKSSEISKDLENKGRMVTFGDIFISGILLSNGIKTIVSNNKERFKNCGLKVELY